MKGNYSVCYPINLTADYVKMLYYYRIDVSVEIDENKSSKSKECMICHYWYFLDRDSMECEQK